MKYVDGRFKKNSIYGFGIFDLPGTSKSFGKSYSTWRSMITRCYSSKYQEKQITYKACEIVEQWALFSDFNKWFVDNYRDGWELDKDLLGDGTLYSPETCCFVPKALNLILPKKNTKSLTPTGVTFRKNGKYTCQVTEWSGKIKHLGTFLSESKAFNAYKNAKQEIIREAAENFKNVLDEKVYNRLISIDLGDYLHKTHS